MGDVVTIDNVRLKSVSVTIRAIQIDNKQMTQAVYNQLPAVSLWDPVKEAPRGIVWGWVNHCPRGCVIKSVEHRHIIWQHGSALFRTSFTHDGREYPSRSRARMDSPKFRAFLEKVDEQQLFIAV